MPAAPVAIEVALNGPWGRARVAHLPIEPVELIAQGIACAEAGAAVIHLHAYDPATGRQNDDWRIYARIIEGIRARVDAIVYPTIPLAGSGLSEGEHGARFAHAGGGWKAARTQRRCAPGASARNWFES